MGLFHSKIQGSKEAVAANRSRALLLQDRQYRSHIPRTDRVKNSRFSNPAMRTSAATCFREASAYANTSAAMRRLLGVRARPFDSSSWP